MCLSLAIERPNDVLATGEHKGFQWVVVHNGRGYRCGYIKVSKGHPWYGKDYDDIDARVHGGLTFAAADVPCDKGGPDDGWWLGFDTNHAGDAPDPRLPVDPAEAAARAKIDARMERAFGPDWMRLRVRTQEYVEAECRSLCEQAAAAIRPLAHPVGSGMIPREEKDR